MSSRFDAACTPKPGEDVACPPKPSEGGAIPCPTPGTRPEDALRAPKPADESRVPFAGGLHGEDFKHAIKLLEKRGREQYGEKFCIDTIDHATVYALFVYFLRLEREATRLGIDLSKGILLLGPVGCGKTSLMTLMKSVAIGPQHYTMRSCREITFEFMRDDFEVISRYSQMSFDNGRPKTYCFDDLGSENTLRQYGNSCNVMAEIIQSRHELFLTCDMITHVTTNLHASGIEQAYGDRVRSRMREMFNVVGFDKNTRDKRV
jgi:hypothetical protein